MTRRFISCSGRGYVCQLSFRRGERDLREITDQADFARIIFDQRGTGLHPVAAVVIFDVADRSNGNAVNVATEHGIDFELLRIMSNGFLKSADEIDRVLDPFLCVSAEGPVTETEAAADEIDRRIERKEELIANVAGKRQPLHVLDDGVEFVTMNDQNSFAGRCDMDGVALDVDVSVRATEISNHLVMITRDVNDAGAFACFA